ncbi:hypothetical protein N7493_003190 [Penicillium malachiteum]|uniref:F-box domain-containing protein n=1 Tax=Penicillium malachiteum TaxID=1324776 RepID=A0AAD6HTC8_9EURO|nr:hypothetical protein N7493_003190 [Penicillium malachiteum]
MEGYEYEVFCVFCGAPFSGGHISSKPRTERFQRAREFSSAKFWMKHFRRAGQPIPDSLIKTIERLEAYGDEEAIEGTEEWNEDHSYDPEILSEEQAAWARSVRCSGLNPYAKSTTKCFVSAQGRMDHFGNLEFDSLYQDDPNIPDEIVLKAFGLHSEMPGVYPFHSECLEIFKGVLAHKAGVKWTKSWVNDDWELSAPEIDKETLYTVLDSLADITPFTFLDLDYGMLMHCRNLRWHAEPGEEVLLANPVYLEENVCNEMLDAWKNTVGTTWALSRVGTAVGDDPFTQLSFELLDNMFSRLDLSSLLKLLQASPYLYRSFGNSQTFWRRVMDHNMPWFFEMELFQDGVLQSYGVEGSPAPEDCENDCTLDHTAPRSAHGKSLRRLCLWVNYMTTAVHGMKWPMMGVANRRRIWKACEPIVEQYLSRAAYPGHELTNAKTIDLDPQILESATCFRIPLVSIPKPKEYHAETVFWVRDWNDIHSAFTLKIFWNSRKNLVGLGARVNRKHTPNLRLFGASDSQDGYTVDTVQVQNGDWIQGFILHYPQIYSPPEDNEIGEKDETDVVGITVLLQSGAKESFGDVDAHRVKRLLMAAEGMVIVGLTGHVGVRETPTGMMDMISRIGLLQCPLNGGSIEDKGRPDENFEMEKDSGEISTRPLLKTLPLTDDCSSIFTVEDIESVGSKADIPSLQITRTASATGVSLWDLPNLRVHQNHGLNDVFPTELKSYQPLIWAKNKTEARALRRLTCYIKEPRPKYGDLVYGLRAEYTPSSKIKRRKIQSQKRGVGSRWKAEGCLHMPINGAKGEVISTISVATRGGPNHFSALKLVTNLGRQVSWGNSQYPHREHTSFTAPDGEMIIGILVSFGRPWSDSHMSTVIVLSMPVS